VIDVLMPQLGETVTSGTILTWRKRAGERVAADEILFEVESDKASMEIPTPAAGTLIEVLVQEGETVAAGTRVAVIGPATE
jgi:2-oxoglutarate dehydrogenase E2 component (dihydrolipoamide succinyltransferase)